MYYGTGDTGGSPNERSVKLMEAIVTRGAGRAFARRSRRSRWATAPSASSSATSDQMFLDISPESRAKLPRYKGDLELTNHSAGSITSQAYMKRWNRRNEVLADDAERASVAADWLGGRAYPRRRLNDAWTLVMGGQFHDIIPGTSIPKAYEYAWNDEVLALNQFGGVLTDAVESVAAVLDTRVQGSAVVVTNGLSIAARGPGRGGRRIPRRAAQGRPRLRPRRPGDAGPARERQGPLRGQGPVGRVRRLRRPRRRRPPWPRRSRSGPRRSRTPATA